MINQNLMFNLLVKTKSILPSNSPEMIDDSLVKIWCSLLGGHEARDIQKAFFKIWKTESFYPNPKVVLGILGDDTRSDLDIAKDTVDKIKTSIGKFGPHDFHKVTSYIGRFGMLVVREVGGWAAIKDIPTQWELDRISKQWLPIAQRLSQQVRAKEVELPALPAPRQAPDVALPKRPRQTRKLIQELHNNVFSLDEKRKSSNHNQISGGAL